MSTSNVFIIANEKLRNDSNFSSITVEDIELEHDELTFHLGVSGFIMCGINEDGADSKLVSYAYTPESYHDVQRLHDIEFVKHIEDGKTTYPESEKLRSKLFRRCNMELIA